MFVSCFQVLGFEPSVRGRKYLVFSARVFDQPKKFNVFLKHYNPSAAEMRRFKTIKRTTYCFAWTEDDEEVTRGKNYYEFEELSAESVKKCSSRSAGEEGGGVQAVCFFRVLLQP